MNASLDVNKTSKMWIKWPKNVLKRLNNVKIGRFCNKKFGGSFFIRTFALAHN